MMTDNHFAHEPDHELGALLREALDAGDPVAFVARVRSRVETESQDGVFDALARWSLPGLAAAAIMLVTLGAWWSQASSEPLPTPAEQLVADGSLDRSARLDLVLEDR